MIDKCINVLKRGGILFVSFISAFAPIVDMIKRYPQKIIGAKERLLNYISDGTNIVSEENPGFTDAWFENPSNIEGFIEEHPLDKLVITATEGLLSPNEETINNLPEDCFNEYINFSMILFNFSDVSMDKFIIVARLTIGAFFCSHFFIQFQ